jgi:aryl-alcohol dehydrogenase-like predicted oxidoreductase
MAATTLPGGTFVMAEDLTVTRLGYGAMQLAGPHVFGPPADRDAAVAVLREAIELGITHIDTSDFYGPHVTNQIIKEALHPYPNELHIVTKVGAYRDVKGGWPHARSPEQLRQAVHDNLIHLGLDALDVVNLRVGGFDSPTPGSIAEPFTALAEMQREGLIRHLGISTVSGDQVAEAQSIAPIVCVQNFYNLAHRVDDDLIESLAAQDIAYVPYFPLGGFTPLQSGTRIGRHPSGRHTDGRRAGLAAAALPEHPADPRHLLGRASARERDWRGARPFRERAHRAEQHWLTDRPPQPMGEITLARARRCESARAGAGQTWSSSKAVAIASPGKTLAFRVLRGSR